MGTLSRVAAVVLTTVVAPLLPERYRSRWPWADVIGMPGVQSMHGYLWAFLGIGFWAWGFILYEGEMADLVAAVVTDDRSSGDVGPITHYGLVLYFAYLVTAKGFLLTVLLLDGVVRGVAGATSGTVPGNIYLWMIFSLGRWARELGGEARRTSRYGKRDEPDQIFQEGGLLRIRRTRPHADWNADQAFRYGERLYCLHNFDPEVQAGERLCVEYTFKPWPEGRTLRRVVTVGSPAAPAQDERSPG
jgi:hypothetical protein